MQNWWKDQWGNSPIKSDCTSTTPLLGPLRSEPLALESHWNWARKIMIQQVGVQVKFGAACVCVWLWVWVYKGVGGWQLPWGVAKRSLCTILRIGSKMSECCDFKWPELWPQETRGCLHWFLHHYVWHMWRSLLISVQICIQSSGAVFPLFTCLPSKKL